MSSGSGSSQCGEAWNEKLAMKIVLDNIALNDFIEDRCTKLICRQVCREWRVHGAFSDSITSVTIGSPKSAVQLLKYFPPNPHIRSPWRTLEESVVFSNLRKIYICSLCDYYWTSDRGSEFYLSNCPELKSLITTCRRFAVSLELPTYSQLVAELPIYSSICTVSSLTLGRDETKDWYKSDFKSIFGLSGLTSLTLLRMYVFPSLNEAAKLRCLTCLKSLGELRLQMIFEKSSHLRGDLEALATLSHVTHLELEITLGISFEEYSVSLLESELQDYAPESLRKCIVHSGSLPFLPSRDDIGLHYATFQSGKLCGCHISLYITPEGIQSNDAIVEDVLERDLAGRDVQSIRLDLSVRAQSFSKIFFGTRALRDIKELEFKLSYYGFSEAVVQLGPVFQQQDDVCLSATRLHFELGQWIGYAALDFTHMLDVLPSVLPNLQQLSLSGMSTWPANLSTLSQLTCLEHLSMSCYRTSGLVVDLHDLPPLLKTLNLEGLSLHSARAPPLPHLTRLELVLKEVGSPLSVFSQSAAPLKDLTLDGQESLDDLVTIFPCLEKLTLLRCVGEPSSLLGLKLLRELNIELPSSKVPQLDHLTQVFKLRFREHWRALDFPKPLTHQVG